MIKEKTGSIEIIICNLVILVSKKAYQIKDLYVCAQFVKYIK